MDGTWTTDSNARQEDDGHNNINNVLLPEDLKSPGAEPSVAAVMSGVTPASTTAALAAGVPKESEKQANGTDTRAAVVSSAAPESTTAELAKEVPREQNGAVPGSFPETPAKEGEQQLSVNPIPASSGIGNPIQLAPGESVPHPSTFNPNTVESTVRTDDAAYAADAGANIVPGVSTADASASQPSAFAVPPVSKDMIPESSLPMGDAAQVPTDAGVTIQSAAPTSTTAMLAAAVPLESRRREDTQGAPAGDVPDVVKASMAEAHQSPEAAANAEAVKEKEDVEHELQQKVSATQGGEGTQAAPVSDVPEVVKSSMAEAHQSPEAAANAEAVREKEDVEHELQQKVSATQVEADAAAPVGEVPEPVQKSIAEAHQAPEAAASPEAVKEKKQVEEELQSKVPEQNVAGEPAPTVSAATATTAPAATGNPPSTELSPRSTPPPSTGGPTVTTGVAAAKTSEVSAPQPATTSTPSGAQAKDVAKDKKKKRSSGFFSKLKEKFK